MATSKKAVTPVKKPVAKKAAVAPVKKQPVKKTAPDAEDKKAVGVRSSTAEKAAIAEVTKALTNALGLGISSATEDCSCRDDNKNTLEKFDYVLLSSLSPVGRAIFGEYLENAGYVMAGEITPIPVTKDRYAMETIMYGSQAVYLNHANKLFSFVFPNQTLNTSKSVGKLAMRNIIDMVFEHVVATITVDGKNYQEVR